MDEKSIFGPRVAYYVQARPDYPPAVLACLRDEYGLQETAVIADIGSGTGKLARLFLEHGHRVFGVEPDAEMRAASELYLQEFLRFTAVAGSATFLTMAGPTRLALLCIMRWWASLRPGVLAVNW